MCVYPITNLFANFTNLLSAFLCLLFCFVIITVESIVLSWNKFEFPSPLFRSFKLQLWLWPFFYYFMNYYIFLFNSLIDESKWLGLLLDFVDFESSEMSGDLFKSAELFCFLRIIN